MKYTLIALFAFTVTAKARIGETPDQCILRYGKPEQILHETQQLVFQKSGLKIVVGFYNGKADSLGYCKAEQTILGQAEELSENEIQYLLKLNSDLPWKKMNTISMDGNWQNENSTIFATYRFSDHILAVMTKNFLDRTAAETKSKEEQNLNGL